MITAVKQHPQLQGEASGQQPPALDQRSSQAEAVYGASHQQRLCEQDGAGALCVEPGSRPLPGDDGANLDLAQTTH